MFQNFWEFTNKFVHFSNREKELIQNKLVIRSIPKQHTLVDLGAVCNEAYFIKKGCVRLYYITESGDEITGFIFQEHMMCSAHESYFSQVPSTQILEAIEPCELLVLSYENLQRLYWEVPKMNEFVRKLLEERMANAQKVVASLIMNKPEERYISLLSQQPDLIHRIPQKMLASYIGITPVSLSRIRKRIIEAEI